MKVIFCSFLFDNLNENMEKAKIYVPMAGHIYQMSFLDGLKENAVDFTILNTRRVNRYPFYTEKKFKRTPYVFEGDVIGVNISFNNRWGINFFSKVYNLMKELSSLLEKNKNEKCIVVVYNTPLPIIVSAILTKLIHRNIHLCASIGDMPGGNKMAKNSFTLREIKLKIINFAERFLIRRFDSFVFVTDQMAEALDVLSKPHVVVECLYKSKLDNDKEKLLPIMDDIKYDKDNKIVFYAGTINENYGVRHMLESFALIKNEDYLFIIAGDGDAVSIVKEYEEKDKRIHYLGVIYPEEVKKIERISTVIVNPRLSTEDFVKYSFPSKTFTGLASGVPFIAHKLPCYSNDFDEYIQYPRDESAEALRDKIVEICELSREERKKIGESGKKFIEISKNHIVLTKKIMEMWSRT